MSSGPAPSSSASFCITRATVRSPDMTSSISRKERGCAAARGTTVSGKTTVPRSGRTGSSRTSFPRAHQLRFARLRSLPCIASGLTPTDGVVCDDRIPYPCRSSLSEVSAPHSLPSSVCLLLGPKEPRALHASLIWWPLAAAAARRRIHRRISPLSTRRRLRTEVELPPRTVRIGLAIRGTRGVQQDGGHRARREDQFVSAKQDLDLARRSDRLTPPAPPARRRFRKRRSVGAMAEDTGGDSSSAPLAEVDHHVQSRSSIPGVVRPTALAAKQSFGSFFSRASLTEPSRTDSSKDLGSERPMRELISIGHAAYYTQMSQKLAMDSYQTEGAPGRFAVPGSGSQPAK